MATTSLSDSHTFMKVGDVFNEGELQSLDLIRGPFRAGTRRAGGSIVVDTATKDNRVLDLGVMEHAWVFRRLAALITKVNGHYFGFDLVGIKGAQILEYGLGQHYAAHVDHGPDAPGMSRKLTLSVQLTPEDQYSGGDLELDFGTVQVPASRTCGDGLFFASWVLHRVAPVLSGTRRCLVVNIVGPMFR